jgi:hypothetical protein
MKCMQCMKCMRCMKCSGRGANCVSNYLKGDGAEEITLELCRRMEQMRVNQNISQNDIAAEVALPIRPTVS